jgi:hypothetical protein
MSSPICSKLLDLDALHFTPDEVRSLNELVVTAVLKAPALSLFSNMVTGIKNDRRIGIIPGTFGLIGKAAQSCDPVADCVTDTAIEKTWEPRYIELILDECIDDLGDTMQKLAIKNGIEVYDLTKTEIFTFMVNILSQDIQNMIFRYAWFGDKDAANYPAGVITPGVSTEYFDVIDGFFHQLYAILTADANRVTAMIGNAQLTSALQDSVQTAALTYANVNTVIDAALPELQMQPDRILLVTYSVAQRLHRHLQALGVAYNISLATEGLQISQWDGITMYALPLWDQYIRAYENTGVRRNYPHRVVYTCKSNLLIGIAGTSLFDRINTFYDPRSRYNRIEAVDAMDAKIIDDRLVQIGL